MFAPQRDSSMRWFFVLIHPIQSRQKASNFFLQFVLLFTEICQHTLCIRQHFPSAHCACGSKIVCSLPAYAAHAVALCQRTLRLQQQIAYVLHMLAICKRMLRIRQQFASKHCAYGNKSQNIPNILCFASVCCACGSNLLAHTAHTVAICQHMLRMRQQFASLDGACGSKNKMARITPICKKSKIFILFHP